jgi:FixJ family two-component response regulator
MNRGFLMGAALAAGAVLLVPGVAVALGRAGRPMVRAAMKTGAVAFTEFRRAGAEVYEHMEDIAAELRAEMAEAEEAADAAATAAAGEAAQESRG